MTKEEYRTLLVELYKENQSFLNKAIFAVSTLAIPFLFKVLSEQITLDLSTRILLLISLFGFFIVVCLQVASLKSARDGCDKSMEECECARRDGERLFNRARLLDIFREYFFGISLFLILIALILNILNGENSMSKKTLNNSLTPPKSIVRENLQESFVPPKASVSSQRSYVPPQSTVAQNQNQPTGTTTNQPPKDNWSDKK